MRATKMRKLMNKGIDKSAAARTQWMQIFFFLSFSVTFLIIESFVLYSFPFYFVIWCIRSLWLPPSRPPPPSSSTTKHTTLELFREEVLQRFFFSQMQTSVCILLYCAAFFSSLSFIQWSSHRTERRVIQHTLSV